MKNIVACVDGSAISTAVCDAAAWASQRLQAPLTLLHVLEKNAPQGAGNLSGNIGPGSREHLLEELTALDEQRSRLALEYGKHLLEQAERRARQDGAVQISRQQRHGNLMETLLELEAETRLLVMGRQGEGHDIAAHTLGSQVESVVRAMHRPIMMIPARFETPRSFMVAYDGSDTVGNALDLVARSPLLQGLASHLVMVGGDTPAHRTQLERALEALRQAGFDAMGRILAGGVTEALGRYRREHDIDLMIMGAYGHSRIRQFLVGSNTTRMISKSDMPLMLLR